LGTPQEEVYKDKKVLSHLTRKERDDKYDLNRDESRGYRTKMRGECVGCYMVDDVKRGRDVDLI